MEKMPDRLLEDLKPLLLPQNLSFYIGYLKSLLGPLQPQNLTKKPQCFEKIHAHFLMLHMQERDT